MRFAYERDGWPIPDAIVEANRGAWERLARPGSWWSGAERVAIAAEARVAHDCSHCRERRQALSPLAVAGTHDVGSGLLPAPAVEAIHRLVTDAGRITRRWFDGLGEAGLEPARYVEIVGVVSTLVGIDAFHEALGLPLEPLPRPEPGEPRRVLPQGLVDLGAFVPMIPASKLAAPERDLYGGLPVTANVIAAMSMVPDCVRQLGSLSHAYYVPFDRFLTDVGRTALTRPQIELVAARVSALNECFY